MTPPQDVATLASVITRTLRRPIAESARSLACAREIVKKNFNDSVSSGRLLGLYRCFKMASGGRQLVSDAPVVDGMRFLHAARASVVPRHTNSRT